MKKLLLFALSVITIQVVMAQGTWTQKADFGGTARSGATGFSIGTKGYIGTGFGLGNRKDFWEYDPAANTWTQKADFGGTARYYATGFSIGTKGYIGTGDEGISNAIYKKDFWEYDPSANTWTRKADFAGTARSEAIGFSIGTKGYIGTGYAGSSNQLKDFWEYDPSADTWTQKADFGGIARSLATGFSISTKGYIGTGSGVGFINQKDFWEYDPSTNIWTRKADFGGSERFGATGFSISPKGYIGTGTISGGSTKDFWEYDPSDNTWIRKSDFEGTARNSAIGFSIGTKGYIGTGTISGGSTKDFWEYTSSGTTPPAAAPTATTGGAIVVIEQSIQNQYAQIRGTVNANGSTTTVFFEYGSTKAYGSTISGSPGTVTGNSNTAVSATINRLPTNQLYHYRIVAQNAGGTTYGEDSTFYTLVYSPNAPIVSDPTATTLRVNVDYVSPNSGGTMYVIRETTTGKYLQSDGSLGTTLAFSSGGIVRGLAPNTTYSFSVGARSEAYDRIVYGPSASGTTTSLPTLTTNAPGLITANSAEFRGTINPNNRSAQVGFQYGKTTAYGSFISVTTVTGNSDIPLAKVVTGLEANELYHYRLYAGVVTQSGIDDANGNDVTFYTLANTPTAPVVGTPTPSTLTVAIGGGDANPSNTTYALHETTTNKYVQADGSLGTAPVFQTAAACGTKTVTGLAAGTTYTFEVKARNGDNIETAFGPSASGNTSGQNVITYTPKDFFDLSLTSSWMDEKGNPPPNFTSPNQIFLITSGGIYRAPLFVRGPWTISGGSKVVLQHQYNLEFLPAARLNIGAGSEVNFNNNPVILKSDATGTASIGTISGTLSNATFVIAERFIPARRAWRMINVPLVSSNTQTFSRFVNQSIYTAWQVAERRFSPNQDFQNPSPGGPGFGTHITGGSAAQGFDQSPTNSSSIKTYDNATDTWQPVPNTNATSVSSNVFMLFVRGDRTIDLSKGTAAPPTNTVLPAGGSLRIGDQTFTVNATGFTPIPNPYPSAINFATITKNNVPNSFYVWDPKMSGPDGVGAFVNVSFNGSTYDVTPTPASPISQYIQSHESFLVRSTGAAGSLVIKETDKSTGGSDNVFRTGGVSQNMRVNLVVNNADNTTSIADGVLESYNTDFSDAIDDMDAVKITNFNENIGILRNGQTLTVERRSAISANDTIFLKLWNTAQTSYHLQFDPSNFSSSAIAAYLVDNYQHTSTPVSMSSISDVEFTVTANVASAAADRFMVVFKANSTLPVNFTTVKAYQQSANIQVDWNVAAESNILTYEVERSSNGVMFTKAGAVAAKANNNAAVAYNWTDVAPYVGNNYYRIKAVTLTGDVKYTQVVNVKTGKGRSEITAYPNPITNRTINLQLVNQAAGTYIVELVNNLGQVLYRNQIKHAGGSATQPLQLNNKPAKGVYQLKVSNGDTKNSIQIICD